jgi:CubicO group peptidase (beta-lactamase class C family)
VHGFVAPGFEGVRDAFVANFTDRREIGAAYCVHLDGEVVVDLWGGVADPTTGRPWARDTPMIVFSATKGLAALRMLQLTEQGVFDPDAPVASYWPGFEAQGKEQVTGRMILNHRAGLSALDAALSIHDFADPSGKVAAALAAQRPTWSPDTDQGYAACSYGAYVGELHRRLTGESLGRAFQREIAEPLGLDTWIGAPAEAIGRAARLVPVDKKTVVTRHVPTLLTRRTHEGRLFRRIVRRSHLVNRAFTNPDMGGFEAVNDPRVLGYELPWMGALTTARSLSRAYAAMVGPVDGVQLVKPASLAPLRGRQSWSTRDRVLQKPLGWSQGFLKEESRLFSPNPNSFGHAGAGGSVGWVDPDRKLAIGYAMNRMDWRIRSPRALALAWATNEAVAARISP